MRGGAVRGNAPEAKLWQRAARHSVAVHGDHRRQRLVLLLRNALGDEHRRRAGLHLLHGHLHLRHLQPADGHVRGQGAAGGEARRGPRRSRAAPGGAGLHRGVPRADGRLRRQQRRAAERRGVQGPGDLRKGQDVHGQYGPRDQAHGLGLLRAQGPRGRRQRAARGVRQGLHAHAERPEQPRHPQLAVRHRPRPQGGAQAHEGHEDGQEAGQAHRAAGRRGGRAARPRPRCSAQKRVPRHRAREGRAGLQREHLD
mmetsp:Transcript_32053/g.95356  ORF Transcript_32053/g.95356 Transcript_32053/m.95356 type:complete len:255 (+) Transcript_32053:31-795(+)